MKYRYSGYLNYPRLDLTPDEFKPFGGVVEVHFLNFNVDGLTFYAPRVALNCSLRELTPADARAWADALKLAADIAAERLANLTPELRQMAETAHAEARRLAKETA